MFLIETNNGKVGGTLKGKPHNDKQGNPIGGIKAVVTDANKPVELEGGEVIINKAAAKKHWKKLSEINQSAGGGVPIQEPQFGKGGVLTKGQVGVTYFVGKPEVMNAGRFGRKRMVWDTIVVDENGNKRESQYSISSSGSASKQQLDGIRITKSEFDKLDFGGSMANGGYLVDIINTDGEPNILADGGGVGNTEVGSYYLTWDFNKDGDLSAKKGSKEFVIKADTHIGKGNYDYALFTNGVKHWFTGDISSLKKTAQRQSQESYAKGGRVKGGFVQAKGFPQYQKKGDFKYVLIESSGLRGFEKWSNSKLTLEKEIDFNKKHNDWDLVIVETEEVALLADGGRIYKNKVSDYINFLENILSNPRLESELHKNYKEELSHLKFGIRMGVYKLDDVYDPSNTTKMAKGGDVKQSVTYNGETYTVGDVGMFGKKNPKRITIIRIAADDTIRFTVDSGMKFSKKVDKFAKIGFRIGTQQSSAPNKPSKQPKPQATPKNTSATGGLYLEVGDVFEANSGKWKVTEFINDKVKFELIGGKQRPQLFPLSQVIDNFKDGSWKVISTEKFAVGEEFKAAGEVIYTIQKIDVINDNVTIGWVGSNGAVQQLSSYKIKRVGELFMQGAWVKVADSTTQTQSVNPDFYLQEGDVFIVPSDTKWKVTKITNDIVEYDTVVGNKNPQKFPLKMVMENFTDGTWKVVSTNKFAVGDVFRVAKSKSDKFTIREIDVIKNDVVVSWFDSKGEEVSSNLGDWTIAKASDNFDDGTWVKIWDNSSSLPFAILDEFKDSRAKKNTPDDIVYKIVEINTLKDRVLVEWVHTNGETHNSAYTIEGAAAMFQNGFWVKVTDDVVAQPTPPQTIVPIPPRQKPTPTPKKAPINYEQAMNNWVANTLINTQTVSGDMLKDTIVNNFSIAINNVTQ